MYNRVRDFAQLVVICSHLACSGSTDGNVSPQKNTKFDNFVLDVTSDGPGSADQSFGQAPVGLVADPMDGAVVLTWGLKPGAVPDGFLLYYRAGLPGPPWDGEGSSSGVSPVFVANSTTVTIAGLDNDSTYYFSVAAVISGQPGPKSGVVKATPRRNIGAQVLVPAGIFTMGASPGIHGLEEEPEHSVYLDAFWMDRYVATNAQYRACVLADACDPPARSSGYVKDLTFVPDYFENALYDEYPVVFLEHEKAADYCAWRGMRLPTEAEWEKAARGIDGDPLSYPWGNDILDCSIANFNNDGVFCVGGTVPVGTFSDNMSPYGVVELSGNVWQWTADWFHPTYYHDSPCKNPLGPPAGFHKVLRGGAWYYPSYGLGITYRNHWKVGDFELHGDEFSDYRGFGVRCVREAVGVPCDPTKALCEFPAVCGEEGEGGDSASADAEQNAQDSNNGDSISVSDGMEIIDAGCTVPEYISSDPPECFVPPDAPLCPSGYPGCPSGVCACALGATADPGTCGQATLQVTLGWNDVQFAFNGYNDGDGVEICQGLQGGIHILTAITLAVPGQTDDIFQAHVYGTIKIDGILAGVLRQYPPYTFQKISDGVYRLKPKEVRFEGCNAGSYVGKNATLDVLVRDDTDRWGAASVKLLLKDDVVGPWYDAQGQHNCTGF